MATIKHAPQFLENLKKSLINGLKVGGISAKVETEAIPTTKLHRVYVQAPKFKALKHYERQNLVWKIAQNTLSPEDQLRISMILTMTPAEFKGK